MNWIAKRILQYAYQRALEASTWRNLILLVGGTWAATHPDLVTALLPFCIAAAGLLGAALPDLFGSTRLIATVDETRSHDALPPIQLQAWSESAAGAVDPQPHDDEPTQPTGWNG